MSVEFLGYKVSRWEDVIQLCFEDGYDIATDGVIRNLGKFQWEHVATLYYWECSLNGGEESFVINPEERRIFRLDPMSTHFVITQREDGFVLGDQLTPDQYHSWLEREVYVE